jgi:hypothetical protein
MKTATTSTGPGCQAKPQALARRNHTLIRRPAWATMPAENCLPASKIFVPVIRHSNFSFILDKPWFLSILKN